MAKKRPEWCPFLNPDAKITCVANCECKTRSRESKGSSAFCMGKTQTIDFEIDGYRHTNGYIFCANVPFATPDHKFKIFALCVNKQDMENLHKMIHVATGEVGFMASGSRSSN